MIEGFSELEAKIKTKHNANKDLQELRKESFREEDEKLAKAHENLLNLALAKRWLGRVLSTDVSKNRLPQG